MKRLLATIILALSWSTLLLADQLEIKVHGMTCAFCVDSLQRNLGKLPDVGKVDVSLKTKRVRLETQGDKADIERIKQTVLDAGFTLVEINKITDVQ